MYQIDHLNLEQYKSIILQFPNNQLQEAQHIWRKLNQNYPEKEFIISSDPLHSSCCVNLIAAMHINHDLIIHFGEACFSELQQDKIIYIFPYVETDQKKINDYLLSKEETFSVLFDQKYDHFETLNTHHIVLSSQIKNGQHIAFGYYAPEVKDQLIFIGNQESELFLRFITHFAYGYFKKCIVLDPNTFQEEVYAVNQLPTILKRSKQVEEAQNCECFGILINNATASYTKRTLNLCKQLLKQNNKKYYIFSMNSLNEPKLGNFPEIEAYIIISCYRHNIIETKTYYKLIITPFQLIQAFNQIEYRIESDLSLIEDQNIIQQQEINENQPIQQNDCKALISLNNNGEIIPLNKIFQSLDFYKSRSYQGLELRKNMQPSIIEQGLSGIASEYQSEVVQKKL